MKGRAINRAKMKIGPRVISATIVVLLLAYPRPADQVVASLGDQSPSLGKRTTVTARVTATVEVSLQSPATISASWFENPHLRVSSRSRFAAIALQSLDRPRVILVKGSYRYCPRRRCPHAWPVEFLLTTGMSYSRNDTRVTIPRGRYSLTLISPRDPITARITLPELDGRSSIVATEKPPSQIEVGSGFTESGYQPPVNSSYSESQLDERRGFALAALWLEAEADLGGRYGACFYNKVSVVGSAGYQPTCPLADTSYAITTLDPQGDHTGTLLFALHPRVPKAMSVWYAAAADVSATGSLFARVGRSQD